MTRDEYLAQRARLKLDWFADGKWREFGTAVNFFREMRMAFEQLRAEYLENRAVDKPKE